MPGAYLFIYRHMQHRMFECMTFGVKMVCEGLHSECQCIKSQLLVLGDGNE